LNERLLWAVVELTLTLGRPGARKDASRKEESGSAEKDSSKRLLTSAALLYWEEGPEEGRMEVLSVRSERGAKDGNRMSGEGGKGTRKAVEENVGLLGIGVAARRSSTG
jgi:hypothetical protein